MRTALYIRVSTDEQAKEGFSIPAQKERLTQYVQSQDWTIYDCYIEEGASAKDTNRPELNRLMKDVRNKNVDIVLVYRLDRLTRSVLDLYTLLQEFEKYEVKFKSATEVYDTTSAIGRLFLTLVAALAQWERENLAERVRFGMEQMVQQEKRPGGPSPLGFDLVHHTLKINKKEAPIVRYIYDRYLTGIGMNTIAIECNQIGYRTKKGNLFTRNSIFDILNNPVYYGALRWNYQNHTNGKKRNERKDWIVLDAVYPAIINKEQFERVQQTMEKRRQLHPRQLASSYIFTGLLRCARCGSKMIGHTITKKKSTYTLQRYLCKNTKLKQCDCPALTDSLLEEAFLPLLRTAIAPYTNMAKTVYKNLPRKEHLEHEHFKNPLQKIQEKRKRVQIAFSEGIIELDELRERMAEIQEQERQIQQKLALNTDPQKSRTQEEVIHLLTNPQKVWSLASTEERKHLTHLLLKQIIVDLPDEQRKNRKQKKVIIKEIEFQ